MNITSYKLVPNVRQVILLLLAGWLIFNLAQTVGWVLADYPQIPVADYWREPQYWPQYKAFHWSGLWVQQNEHRILFPELTYIADMFFLHGRMYLPIALSGLCHLSIWFVLLWATYSRKVWRGTITDGAVLLAGCVIVWKGCSSLIATPFQLQFTLAEVMVALALAFLTVASESGRWKHVAAIIVCAGIATYSTGNGMAAWPVLMAGAVLLKFSKRQLVALGVAACGLIGLYFVGYQPMASAVRTNLAHPLLGIEFVCSYFSMPFGYFKVPAYGIRVGAVNIGLMSFCAVWAWRRGLLISRLGLFVFGLYLFNLVSAVLTMAGRMELTDYHFASAKVGRYVTMPMVSWALLVMAVLWLLNLELSGKWACAAGGLLAWFFGSGFGSSNAWLEFARLELQQAQVSAGTLSNNVFYPDQIRTIFPDPEFVRANLPTIQSDHKFVFAHGPDKWIGGDIRKLPLSGTPIAGKVTRVYPVPGGLEIFGWADDATSLTNDHAVLFVEPDTGRIVGFGRRPAAGMPVDLNTWDSPSPFTFVGFVALDGPLEKLSVYVRTFHGKLVQPIEGTLDVPKFTTLGERTDQAALTDVRWQRDPNWTLKGYAPGLFDGPAPSGPIYASWSGSDAKTGAMRSEAFATPADHCVVLPVLHGLSSYGQSVEVRDGESDKILAELPMLDGRSVWERWRIPIPDGTQTIRVTAQDEGSGPHQWTAVGTPERCP